MAIPTIDASQFLHGSEEAKSTFAKQLVACFSDHGAVKMIGHSISSSAISELSGWSKKYFDLPLDVRRKSVSSGGLSNVENASRGYKGFGEEKVWKLNSVIAPDAKEPREYFDMGPPLDTKFPTPWPDERHLPGFRQYMESQYEIFQQLALQLMQAIEMGTEVPGGTFTESCVPVASELRFNHYPAIATKGLDDRDTSRSWPHTDTGLFSFIFQGNNGLQVEDRNHPGSFVPVLVNDPGEMIVIVANTLERWTNGKMRARVHKVAAPEDWKSGGVPMRRSTVFFFRAGGDKSAGPLPHFVSASQPALYDEIMVSEYNQRRNMLMYG